MSEYRVEELATEAGITVELLRSYQSKGMLPPPRHEGRVAVYDDRHLSRLHEILDLKHQGYSLRMITTLLGGSGGGGSMPSVPLGLGEVPEEPLTLREVAERTRVPPSMLRSLEASGVLVPRAVENGDDRRYSTADVRAVRMLLSLISGGLPIEEFMAAARTQIDASAKVADEACELFLRYVREPLLEADASEEQEAEDLVAALASMLQATTTLIAYNFQRRMLNGLLAELEARGATKELEVLRREARRRRLEVLPA